MNSQLIRPCKKMKLTSKERRHRSLFTTVSFLFLSLCFVAGCGGSSGGGGASPTNSARLYLSENFETGGFGPAWNAAFVDLSLYPPDAGPFRKKDGHGWVLTQYIPSGSDETTSAQVGIAGPEAFISVFGQPDISEVYVEWDEFFPDDHDFANGSQKLFRLIRDEPTTSRGTEANVWTQLNNANVQLNFLRPEGDFGPNIDMAANLERGLPTGAWLRVGAWMKLNTPGEADGFGRLYLDGRLIMSLEDVNNRGEDSRGWNVLWIGGNHSNQGPTNQSSERFIDNIVIYNSKPSN